MESLCKLQFNLNSTINRARQNFRKSPKERITVSYVETRLESLESSWSAFNSNHFKIVSEIKPGSENIDYFTKEVYELTEELYLDYKTELKENLVKLSNIESPKVSKGDQEKNVVCNVKLPKLELPLFSGQYSEWVTFKDLFVSLIDNNKQLDSVQKLQYLKSHLTGEAEKLLRHIPITADNYEICWSQLKNRYNNKKYLSNCILKRLLNQKNITQECSSSLKELLDTTNECLHALKNLEIDTTNWDVIVIYLMSQKLDNESRKQWELYSEKDFPNISQFNEFLEHRYRALEFLNPKQVKQSNIRSHVTIHQKSCPYCSEEHKLSRCKSFLELNVDARREFVQTKKLCFNCLGPNHTNYNCRQATRCHICKKKHFSALHKSQSQENNAEDAKINNSIKNKEGGSSTLALSNGELNKVVCGHQKARCSQVLLPTALVNVKTKSGTAFVLRSLLDQGSQASFITESAVQTLKLKKIPHKGFVVGIGGDSPALTSKAMVHVEVQSRRNPDVVFTVKAHVLSKLTGFLPEKDLGIQTTISLPSAELADPFFNVSRKIDLLLGADVFGQILLDGIIKGPPGTPVAQNTKLGWILSGKMLSDVNPDEEIHYVGFIQCSDDNSLKKFWELEAEPTDHKIHLTEEKKRCEEIFQHTTTRDEAGRYVVKLPYKTDDPKCKYGDSNIIAKRQFFSLERRLARNPQLKEEYSSVIDENQKLGHMEVDKTSSKIRIVFNASCAGSNGMSLNNDLLVGPPLQPELRQTIMRWRVHPICLVADIIKRYKQVKVAEEDTDYQRIYWRNNPDLPLRHYRLLRVTFGTSAAPYLAVRSLQQLARDDGKEYPLAAERVASDFHMDDLMTGCGSIEEGDTLYQQMNHLLNRGGFQPQRWSSNSTELMNKFQGNQFDSSNTLEIKTDEVFKILGLIWNRKSVEFEYTVQLPPLKSPITKRKVVFDVARLFDPLGWLAPVIIKAKVFIQRIWLTGIDWDEELPPLLRKDWITFRNALTKLTEFKIPRWMNSQRDDKSLELHGFSDASNEAYSAVVYARVTDSNGKIRLSLIASKPKVAPIKQVSIPRLEVCEAVLLSKLLSKVASTVNVPKGNLHAWSDFLVVLAWLSNHLSKWKTFGGNRVAEILTIMESNQWSYVPTKENPADCASRGVSPEELNNLEIWRNGPDWLREKTINYNRKLIQETDILSSEKEDDILSRLSTLGKELINDPKVGDVVLIKENNLPPSLWLYGLIIKTSRFGQPHTCRYFVLQNNEIKRPLSKIIVLPTGT